MTVLYLKRRSGEKCKEIWKKFQKKQEGRSASEEQNRKKETGNCDTLLD